MSKRTTIALAALAAGLLVYIVVYERHTLSSAELESRQGHLIKRFVRDRVTKLEVERGNGSWVLVHEETADEPDDDDELFISGRWKLTEPIAWDADEDAVESLLGALEWADARRSLTGLDGADRERFGFNEPRLTAHFTVANERVSIVIGGDDPQGGGVYLQLDDPSVAYVVGKDTFEALDHDANHFRSKDLFPDGRIGHLLSLEWRTEGRTHSVGRDGDRMVIEQAGATPSKVFASTAKVDALTRALAGARITRFAAESPASPADFGLEPAAHHIELGWAMTSTSPEDEHKRAELRVGSVCGEHSDERYLRIDSGPVVCVAAEDLAPLREPPESLRAIALTEVADEDVHSLRIAEGNDELVLTRDEDSGAFRIGAGEGDEPEADGAAVLALLRGLRSLRVVAFEPEDGRAAAGLATPRARIRAFARPDDDAADEAPPALLDISLGKPGDAGTYLARSGEPALLRVEGNAAPFFSSSPLEYRNRQLLRESEEATTRLEVTRGSVHEVIERKEAGFEISSPFAAAADGRAITELVRRLATLAAERFVGERPAPEHGLSSPRWLLTLRFEDREPEPSHDGHGHDDDDDEHVDEQRPAVRQHELRIGAAVGDTGDAFATLDSSPVFVVPEDLVARIRTPLIDRNLVALSRDAVTSIVLRRGGLTTTITPGEEGFAQADGPIMSAIVGLRADGVHRYGAPGPHDGLAAPQLEVEVQTDTDEPLTLRLGAETDGRVFVRRGELDVTYLVDREVLAPLFERAP